MDEKTLKWMIGMVWLGIAVAVLILLVDMKLKNDIVEGLKSAEANSGTGRWDYIRASNGSVPNNGNLRFAPTVAAGTNSEPDQAIPEAARQDDIVGLGDGNSSEGIPSGDE